MPSTEDLQASRRMLMVMRLSADMDFDERRTLQERLKRVAETYSDIEVPGGVAMAIRDSVSDAGERASLVNLFQPRVEGFPMFDLGEFRRDAGVPDSYFETDIYSGVRARGIRGRRRPDCGCHVDGYHREA